MQLHLHVVVPVPGHVVDHTGFLVDPKDVPHLEIVIGNSGKERPAEVVEIDVSKPVPLRDP